LGRRFDQNKDSISTLPEITIDGNDESWKICDLTRVRHESHSNQSDESDYESCTITNQWHRSKGHSSSQMCCSHFQSELLINSHHERQSRADGSIGVSRPFGWTKTDENHFLSENPNDDKSSSTPNATRSRQADGFESEWICSIISIRIIDLFLDSNETVWIWLFTWSKSLRGLILKATIDPECWPQSRIPNGRESLRNPVQSRQISSGAHKQLMRIWTKITMSEWSPHGENASAPHLPFDWLFEKQSLPSRCGGGIVKFTQNGTHPPCANLSASTFWSNPDWSS
jgi:hypothetical protein